MTRRNAGLLPRNGQTADGRPCDAGGSLHILLSAEATTLDAAAAHWGVP